MHPALGLSLVLYLMSSLWITGNSCASTGQQQTQAPGKINVNPRGLGAQLEEAIAAKRRAAENGDAQAQYELANAYTDEAIANTVYWLRKAAEQGHPGAQTELGIFYNSGTGVPKDVAQAMMWWQRAADQHEIVAQWSLGVNNLKDTQSLASRDLALRWLRAAANDTDHARPRYVQTLFLDVASAQASAQLELGDFYRQKAKAETKSAPAFQSDVAEAQKWYLKAAAHKDRAGLEARYELGRWYIDHGPAKEDRDSAKKWLREAAEEGHAGAQHDLAELLEQPDGRDPNFSALDNWLRASRGTAPQKKGEAAPRQQQQDPKAAESARLQQAQDRAESAKWYRASAEQGHGDSLLKMAEHDKADKVEQLKWWYGYLIVCRNHKEKEECSASTDVYDMADELERSITPQQVQQARARATELRNKIAASLAASKPAAAASKPAAAASKPAAASTSPNVPPPVPVATPGIIATPGIKGWQQYSYTADGFSISAPFQPGFQKVSQGNLENHNYNIVLDGNRSLLISVTDMKQGDKLEPKRALPAARDGFLKSLNLKIVSEKEIGLGDHPGIEFEAQSTQWYVKSRLYAVKGTLFNLVSIGPANMPVALETDRVFDSLTLLHSPR